jgi:hypothetical protein
MGEPKKPKKETEAKMSTETKTPIVHMLPMDYQGRCQGTIDKDYTNTMLKHSKNIPDDGIIHFHEMRLPLPPVPEGEDFTAACKEYFNLTPTQMLDKAMGKIKTDQDNLFKKVMFGTVIADADGEQTPVASTYKMKSGEVVDYESVTSNEAGPLYDADRHLLAQKFVDEWLFVPSKSKGVQTWAQKTLSPLVAAGRIEQSVVDNLETVEQVTAVINEMLTAKEMKA